MSLTAQSSNTSSTSGAVLLCLSHLRWNFVYQRPQHVMSRAAAHHTVLFFEEPVFADSGELPRLQMQRQPCGVVVVVPVLKHGMSEDEQVAAQRLLLDRLLSAHPTPDLTLWYYTPVALRFTAHLQPALCIYDCMDELSAFEFAPPPLLELEWCLFERTHLVFTGGRSLYHAKRARHPDCHLFPSSVDIAHLRGMSWDHTWSRMWELMEQAKWAVSSGLPEYDSDYSAALALANGSAVRV
jgi:hypothetical protein